MRMIGLMNKKGYQALVLISQKDPNNEYSNDWKGVVQEVRTHVDNLSRYTKSQL
jgi:hypothetical protein